MSEFNLAEPVIVEGDRVISATYPVTEGTVIRFTVAHDRRLKAYVGRVYVAEIENAHGVSYELVRDVAGIRSWIVESATRYSPNTLRVKFHLLLESGLIDDYVGKIYADQFSDLGTAE